MLTPSARAVLARSGLLTSSLPCSASSFNIAGSGKAGRVMKEDALKAVSAALIMAPSPSAAAAAAPARPSAVAATLPPPSPPARPAAAERVRYAEGYTGPHHDVPVSSMRKVIASRLGESKSRVPHVYVTSDIEIDAALAHRAQLKDAGVAAVPSMNDLVVKAVALALKLVPELGSATASKEQIDVAVAVATPSGLITPIVTGADKKSLGEISANMKDLAARARANKLKPAEFQGGSFTVSNLGMMGIDQFTAIINPPQRAILAVGSGAKRAVLAKEKVGPVQRSDVRTPTIMSVTLSFDRMSVTEAQAGVFLSALRTLVQSPAVL